jgi:plastocyanin domain-containing protein
MRHVLIAAALVLALPALAGEPATAAGGAKSKSGNKVAVKVTEDGFVPREIKVKKGQPTTLEFTRVTDATCMTEIDIPDEKVKEFALPLNKAVSLTITPKTAGVEKFHCSAMGMGDGKIVVED